MFDLFSWSHILIMLTVALVVVGPKDLPRLMNMAGRWAGKARNMANEFKKSFDDMARQSELDELRAEVEKLRATDPVADFGNEIERTLNPVDTETAETRAAAQEEAPAPRSGEYQVSETQTPVSEPDAKPETAQPADPQTAAP
ncbi:MAG: twin-arginine translocase subunit TatB [Alphaproteobacteria bacterium]|jgi:sec-independent protein translocase protein TatB|nr:twin-arginine translocase subunit TatB [Alphaproteobacteria bacterium]